MHTITVMSRTRSEMIDITSRVQELVSKTGMRQGACIVAVPHTTAAIVVNENWDPDVRSDMLEALDRLVPSEAGYRHGEGNSAAHIKSALLGSSVTWPVTEGKLALGTWQGLFLAEFDGPRSRQVLVQTISASGVE